MSYNELDNFEEIICEDICNAIMNLPDVQEWLMQGNKIAFEVNEANTKITRIEKKGGGEDVRNKTYS